MNFEEKRGNFIANSDVQPLLFPINMYKTYSKEFDWLVPDKKLMFKYEDPYANIDIPTLEIRDLYEMQSKGNELISTHPAQKGLEFTAVKATYDFVNSIRAKETELINPSNIIIVEGIMVFAIAELREVFDMKIFVDTADDIRFIRRLKRDMSDRGRTLESVVDQYMDTVRPMHHAFVEPSKKYADIIVPEGGKNDVAFGMLMSMIEKLQNK